VNAPATFLSPTTPRLSSHPQERPTSRYGSSHTQFCYIPADDARGLGIITETSESSASLVALSRSQANANPFPSAKTQPHTLSQTCPVQDGATPLLSSPYVPIAEAARRRGVSGLVPKKMKSGAPSAIESVGSVAVASLSAISPETSVS
jgi:hypothetical protein